MGRLLEAFKTTDGTLYKKIRDAAGRVQHRRSSTSGAISQEAYAGAQRNYGAFVTEVDGETPRAIETATTAEELENVTGIPFTSTISSPITGDETVKEREIRAEHNRFLGFAQRQPHLSHDEAAQRYIEFRNEIKDVSDAQARAVIKDRYGLTGS